MDSTPQEKPFNLLRRFGLASLLVIAVIGVVNSVVLSDFITKRLIEREARLTMEFVQNIFLADGSIGYLTDANNPELAARFAGSVIHFTSMPDVLRINVYQRDHTLLWSTEKNLIGQKFDQNEELEEALGGELAFEAQLVSPRDRNKPEYRGMNEKSEFFIETYIPIRSANDGTVVGAFEVYKAPVALTAAIRDGQWQVWVTSCAGALVLYLTLFWIVRSADTKIRQQYRQLRSAETMAAVGELASSVAHNIRNPLASIRSTAELALELNSPPTQEQAHDIMASVDRIEGWLRDMVSFSHVQSVSPARVDVVALLRECLGHFNRAMETQHVLHTLDVEIAQANVLADRALLGHVFHILLENAMDALPQDGNIRTHISCSHRRVEVLIQDNGCGIEPENMEKLFGLFYTTKPRGLGIGLTLALRAVERFGGTIRVDSKPGLGSTFVVSLPGA